MHMPDITKVQIVAVVQAVIALALALGLDINDATQTSIIALAGAVSSALVIADSIIRNGRSKIAANPEALAMIEKIRLANEKPTAPALNE
jgi:hypothetical protein